jgi:hypothetical protein
MDAELDKLCGVQLQIALAVWWLPPGSGYSSAPLIFPSARGGCPVEHPQVNLAQALAKQIWPLVALPDELRKKIIRKFK